MQPPAASVAAREPAERTQVRGSLRRALPWPIGLSLSALVALVVAVMLAGVIGRYDPNESNLLERLQPPLLFGGTLAHPLGTDQLGRDLLSRTLHGGQVSILVGVTASAIGLLIGAGLGLLAAFGKRGPLDNLIMYLADVQLSMPFILLAISAALVLGSSPAVLVGLAALSVWPSYARVCYGATLSLLERDFVAAATALGGSAWHIARFHIVPNLLAPLTVLVTLNISQVILLESALSFLGIGVKPPTATWGVMIGEGREYLSTAWWIATAPGLLLVALTINIGLIGDYLRDTLDATL